MPAERQLRLDQLLVGSDVQVLEPADVALSEGLVGELRERLPSPNDNASSSFGQPAPRRPEPLAAPLDHELPEEVCIKAVGIQPQLVAPLAGHDDSVEAPSGVAGECIAQARDLHLQRLRGVARRTLAPKLVNEPVGAERLVGVEQ